jgi:F-type H+-transporting ATPase subunit gamma
MPSTLSLRRRIRSVRNISQLTKAMELVAASRMRKAQQNVMSSRPYSQKILEMIGDLSFLQQDKEIAQISPLLEQREVKTIGLVLVTTDKGLAGSINTNAIRRAVRFLNEETGGKPVKVVTIGRKGRDFMVRIGRQVVAEFTALGDAPPLLKILPISRLIIDAYLKGEFDAVYLLYTDFVNTLTVRPNVVKLLPIEPTLSDEAAQTSAKEFEQIDFIIEPNPEVVLNKLLPRYIEIELYQAILENIASEQSSRMVAMRNASDKAKDLVSDLRLVYNKTRQANITREILEVASGAAAMEKSR